jgi:hypothetical protein
MLLLLYLYDSSWKGSLKVDGLLNGLILVLYAMFVGVNGLNFSGGVFIKENI